MSTSIGKKIRLLRLSQGFTQECFAKRVNLTRNYISLLEGGKKTPSVDALMKMAKTFSVPASFFLSDESTVKLIREQTDINHVSEIAQRLEILARTLEE